MCPIGWPGDGGAQMRGDVLRCGIGERVRVRVDEAGEHGVCGEIGDGNAGGGGVGDGLDAVARDEDVGVRTKSAGADVDEFAGEYGLGDGGGLGLLGGCSAGSTKDESCEEERIYARHLRINITFAPRLTKEKVRFGKQQRRFDGGSNRRWDGTRINVRFRRWRTWAGMRARSSTAVPAGCAVRYSR